MRLAGAPAGPAPAKRRPALADQVDAVAAVAVALRGRDRREEPRRRARRGRAQQRPHEAADGSGQEHHGDEEAERSAWH